MGREMPEITTLEPTENLPAIPDPKRHARNALTLWLQGFRSENTRRAYRKELEAFAVFAKHDTVESAAAWLIGLGEHHAHKALDLWRAQKIARGNQPATVNRSMAALNSFVTSARCGGFTALRMEAKGEKTVSYRDTKGPGLPAYLTMLAVARNQPGRRKTARDAAILMLAFGLALRRAEIVALNIGDVDIERSRRQHCWQGGSPEAQSLTLTSEVKEYSATWSEFRRSTDPTAAAITLALSRASQRLGRLLTGDGLLPEAYPRTT